MKLLLAVDGSDYSRKAIEFIASRKTLIAGNPDVHVLNVRWKLPNYPSRFLGSEAVRKYYAEEAEKALRPARKQLQKAGLRPNIRFVVGHPATEIDAIADKENVDLLVLGSKGHSAFGGLLLGSVTHEVLARTQRPTLIVKKGAKRLGDSLRVGIAVDCSGYGPAALKFVLRHPALFGAAPSISLIHSVHIYDLLGMPKWAGSGLPAFSPKEVRRLQDKEYDAAMRPVRKVLKKLSSAPVPEVRLGGDPGDQLSRYAKKRLDVLVLGSHGYGAFKGAVLGSVATRVVANCTVPLLLVRSLKA